MRSYLYIFFFYVVACSPSHEKPTVANKDLIKGSLISYKKADTWGIYDTLQQKIVVPPIYDNLIFGKMNHIFAASKGTKWGVINSLGEEIIPFLYKSVEIQSTYIIVTDQQNQSNLYAPTGRLLQKDVFIVSEILTDYEDKKPILAVFARKGRQGVIDVLTGNIIITAENIQIQAEKPLCGRQWLAVEREHFKGFFTYHVDGRLISNQTYQNLHITNNPRKDKLAYQYSIVEGKKGNYGIMNEVAELTVPCIYKSIKFSEHNKHAYFQTKTNKMGVLDITNGKVISIKK